VDRRRTHGGQWIGCGLSAIVWADPDQFAPTPDDSKSWESPLDRENVIDGGKQWALTGCALTALFLSSGLYGRYLYKAHDHQKEQDAKRQAFIAEQQAPLPTSANEIAGSTMIADAAKYRALKDLCWAHGHGFADACYQQAKMLIAAGELENSADVKHLLWKACEDVVTTPKAC
jgi:hypothetical protein